MPIGLLDILIAIPILIFFLSGFKNGLIEEALGLLGQIIAIFFAFTYMSEFAEYWEKFYTIESTWIPFLSFVVIYIGIILVVKLIIKFLNSLIKFANLSVVNLIFGGLFSGLKGVLLVSVFLIILGVFNQPKEEYRESSLAYEYILPIAPKVYNVLAYIYPGVQNFADQTDQYFKENDFLNIILNQHRPPTESNNQ